MRWPESEAARLEFQVQAFRRTSKVLNNRTEPDHFLLIRAGSDSMFRSNHELEATLAGLKRVNPDVAAYGFDWPLITSLGSRLDKYNCCLKVFHGRNTRAPRSQFSWPLESIPIN